MLTFFTKKRLLLKLIPLCVVIYVSSLWRRFMELDRLLKFFETKINTTLKDDDVFLNKYRQKRNSVFTEKDFEALKKDLTAYAGIDFNEKDISMSELIQLYNSKVDKKDKQYGLAEFSMLLAESMNEAENSEIPSESGKLVPVENQRDVSEILQDLEPTKEELAFAQKYSKVFGEFGNSWDIYQLRAITTMNETGLKRFDELIKLLPEEQSAKDEMPEMYDIYSLVSLASSDLDDNQFEKAKALVQKGMTPLNASTATLVVPDRAEDIEGLISVLTEGKSEDEAKNLIYENSDKIITLFENDEDTYARIKTIIDGCKDLLTPDNLLSIETIGKNISNDDTGKAIELINAKQKENIDNFQILSISALDGEKYEQAKALYLNSEYEGLNIAELVNIDENMRVKIKDYLKSNDIKMNPWDFSEFCQFNEEDLKRFDELSDIKCNNEPLNTACRIKLTRCAAENVEKIKDIPTKDTNITPELLTFMAEAGDDRLISFVKNHSDYNYHVNDLKESVEIRPSGESDDFIRYNKIGKYFDIIAKEAETHTSEKTVVNNNIKRRQEINYKRIPDYAGRTDWVDSQKIDTFDGDGRLIKTETYTLGDLTGVPDIVESFPDGTKRVLQKSTVDQNGTARVEKDFESPDGTRTQVQNIEDSVGNRRSIYKITDKDGNVLLNQTRTFKVLGENKFQSGLNGYNYEIEYSDDSIKITDMQTGKVSDISIGDNIKSENRSSIMNVLKKVDAAQLLVMKLRDVESFTYNGLNSEWLNNAYWSSEKNEIFLGETTVTDSQDAFIRRNFPVLSHEYGHFIDTTAEQQSSASISSNQNLEKIFRKEYEAFLQVATTEEEGFVDYFTGSLQGADRGAEERVAETNMLLRCNPHEMAATRAYYLQRYFPRTVASIADEISKIEQMAAEK